MNDEYYDYHNGGRRATGGIGALDALTIVFIVLKLVGVVTWKWVWVLAPTWIPLVFIVVLYIILGAINF